MLYEVITILHELTIKYKFAVKNLNKCKNETQKENVLRQVYGGANCHRKGHELNKEKEYEYFPLSMMQLKETADALGDSDADDVRNNFV